MSEKIVESEDDERTAQIGILNTTDIEPVSSEHSSIPPGFSEILGIPRQHSDTGASTAAANSPSTVLGQRKLPLRRRFVFRIAAGCLCFSFSCLGLFIAFLAIVHIFREVDRFEQLETAIDGPVSDPTKGSIRVSLDASLDASGPLWLASGIHVKGGQTVSIVPDLGSWVCAGFYYCASPIGDYRSMWARDSSHPNEALAPNAPWLAAVVRLGDNAAFPVNGRVFTLSQTGPFELFFAENIRKSQRYRSRGGHEVTVIVRDHPDQPDPPFRFGRRETRPTYLWFSQISPVMWYVNFLLGSFGIGAPSDQAVIFWSLLVGGTCFLLGLLLFKKRDGLGSVVALPSKLT
jgi:hypothetical protein